jgi:hypothetical protein
VSVLPDAPDSFRRAKCLRTCNSQHHGNKMIEMVLSDPRTLVAYIQRSAAGNFMAGLP